MSKNKKLIVSGVVIVAVSVILRLISYGVGYFGVNTMDCIKGTYFFVTKNKNLHDGDYFAFYFKGSKLYPKGFEFIKIVGCSSGEYLTTKVTKKGTAYYCNGRLLGYACKKTLEFPNCPNHVIYNGVIPVGCYFALGTAYNSYDSRYYGLVCSGIEGKAYKIF